MGKKIDYEEVKSFIEITSNSGCKLLTSKEEYINTHSELRSQCKCGNIFSTDFKRFKSEKTKHRQCKECGRKIVGLKNSKSYDEVLKYINDTDCKLLTTEEEYIYGMKLKIQCKCGEIFYTTFKIFSRKKNPKNKCDKCTLKNIRLLTGYSYEFIFNKILEQGHLLLTTIDEYENAKTKLRIRCPLGHIYEKTWAKFNLGQRCPYCSKKKKYTYEEVKTIIESRIGYKLISKTYINCKSLLKIRCSEGHEFEMTFDAFKNGNCYCPICSLSKGEANIKYCLEENNILYKQQFKFDDCKNINELSFDFAIFKDNNYSELIYLIEYQGEQHYKPVCFGGISIEEAESNFKVQQNNDNIKRKYCKDNNIKLLEIPYWELDNIDKILDYELIKQ